MATFTMWESGTPTGTQGIYDDGAPIKFANQFYLNQDRTGWQVIGARFYITPSLASSLPPTFTISVNNQGDILATPLQSKTGTVGAGGWRSITFDSPVAMSPIKGPTMLVCSFVENDHKYVAFTPADPTEQTSVVTPLLKMSAISAGPSRSGVLIGSTVSGSDFLWGLDITVTAPNEPPTVSIASDLLELRITDQAHLTATVHDDSPGTTVAWTITSGPSTSTSQLSSTTSLTPTFTPSALGTYVLRCTATDAAGATAVATITMPVITPTALVVNAPSNSIRAKLTDHVFTATTTNGFGPKNYTWAMVGAASGVTLTNTNAASVTFRASLTGTYELRCTVTDTLYTASSSFLIQVTELPPQPSAYALWDGSFWIPQHVQFL